VSLQFRPIIIVSFNKTAQDWVYSIHSKWFHIPREAFNIALYSFLGLFKIMFFIFNLVPYLALLIIG